MDDVFDDEVEQTVTIDEYLNNVEAEELNADLVLGGDEVTLTSTICSFLTSYPQKIWAAGGQKGDTTSSNAKSKGVLENVSSACGSGKLGIDICAHDSSEKDNTTANSNSQTVAARNASVVGESSGRVVGQMTQTNAQKIPISILPVLLESMWKLLHLYQKENHCFFPKAGGTSCADVKNACICTTRSK